jgi:FkbM family methyltransferase
MWALKQLGFFADPELLRLFMRYGEYQRAQLLQDLAYLRFRCAEPIEGYFVEVGVGDGEHLSNTYLLEKEFGWQGLLVEPNAAFHASIRERRKARLDPRAAYSAGDGTVNFLECGELSQIQSVTTQDAHRRRGNEVRVDAATLTRILQEAGAPERIAFLSVDTEGSEPDVLRGIDFGHYRFDFIAVEHNYVPARRVEIFTILNTAGYKKIETTASHWDDWFLPLC